MIQKPKSGVSQVKDLGYSVSQSQTVKFSDYLRIEKREEEEGAGARYMAYW